jgi:hypothetical protein
MHSAAFFCATALALLTASTEVLPATGSEPGDKAGCDSVATPDQKNDQQTIRRIEQDWLTAEYRGNARFLECLLEPDYRTSGRDGKIRSRQDLLDRVAQATDVTRAVPTLEVIAVTHGNAAAAHSILRTTDKAGNPKEVHFVDTYTFHDGRWHAFSGADL